jgi:hypothetical protein
MHTFARVAMRASLVMQGAQHAPATLVRLRVA